MINLFGKWINPANICYIEDMAHYTIVNFGASNIEIRKPTQEVVEELGRLLMLLDSEMAVLPKVQHVVGCDKPICEDGFYGIIPVKDEGTTRKKFK